MTSLTIATPSSSLGSTKKEISSCKVHENPITLNDNSNPQQGTEIMTPRVMALSPSDSDEKKMDDDKDHAKKDQPRGLKVPPTVKDSRKLFVGGLPADITEDEFHEFFEQFGKVMDSVVMFDRETKRSRGFGFITFEDIDVCNRLLEMGRENAQTDANTGHLEMRGKLVEVKSAEPRGAGMGRMIRNRQQPRSKGLAGGYVAGTTSPGANYDWQHARQPSQQSYHPAIYGGSPYYMPGMVASPYMYYSQHYHMMQQYGRERPNGVPSNYSETTDTTAQTQYYSYAYGQEMPQSPYVPSAGVPYQGSVMQEVPPGIPGKEGTSADQTNK